MRERLYRILSKQLVLRTHAVRARPLLVLLTSVACISSPAQERNDATIVIDAADDAAGAPDAPLAPDATEDGSPENATTRDGGGPADASRPDGNPPHDAAGPDGGPCDPVLRTGCGAREVCSLTSTAELTCRPAGTTPLGADCHREPCQAGGLCVDVGNGQRCYSSCDENYRCALGQCQILPGLPFGACAGVACSPVVDPCPENQTCSFVAGATDCVAEGTTPIAGDCSSNPCLRGGLCAALDPGGPRCYASCDAAHPCDLGQCTPLSGYPFGLCL